MDKEASVNDNDNDNDNGNGDKIVPKLKSNSTQDMEQVGSIDKETNELIESSLEEIMDQQNKKRKI